MQNLMFVASAVPEILGGLQNSKSRSRELDLWPIFYFFGLVSLTLNRHAKFEVCSFSRSRDIRRSQNSKSSSRDL